MGTFAKLGLKKEILEILTRLKFKESLDVQDQIIPLAIKGKNIVFTSMTGSGKTLAYSLGYLGKINKKQEIQMLIIVPTRDLCIQVGKELQNICEPLNITVSTLYGGRDLAGDSRTTSKKNQILVGTPGRLIQHINEKNIRVGEVKLIVFDESDQMFDNGFLDMCSYIKRRVSKDTQIILASATITDKVHEFIEHEIVDYELLQIGIKIPKNIIQEKILCKIEDKNELLLRFFSKKQFKRVMIFCNTKVKSYLISECLEKNKLKSKYINSDLEQNERQNRLNLFKDGKFNILVATDVAARGLHIENVDLIINYDAPTRAEFYIHRIGRTGRTNKKGYALSIICPEDEERFAKLEEDFQLDVKMIENI
ncbi:MAG: DEAD/DEAH box helicase [Candidatus Woesearchaeota archaeon]